MPKEDDRDGEGFSEISPTRPSKDGEEEGSALSDLSDGLRNLHIKEPAAQHGNGIRVPSALVRRSDSPNHFQMHLVPERENQHTNTIDDSPQHVPAPHGWTRMFPSRT